MQLDGRVAEWFKAPVLKTGRGFTLPRGFESHPFRQGAVNIRSRPAVLHIAIAATPTTPTTTPPAAPSPTRRGPIGTRLLGRASFDGSLRRRHTHTSRSRN